MTTSYTLPKNSDLISRILLSEEPVDLGDRPRRTIIASNDVVTKTNYDEFASFNFMSERTQSKMSVYSKLPKINENPVLVSVKEGRHANVHTLNP